jgi:hypothetical protein
VGPKACNTSRLKKQSGEKPAAAKVQKAARQGIEKSDGFFHIQKAAGIFGGQLYSAEGRFDKRIVVWRP